jgi:hypothetical protein
MSWIVDGVDLSTLAWNVTNRSAGWKVPAKRGENLVIPGRHGAQWVPNKPYDQGEIVLSMWAQGSNSDGTLPTDGDMRKKCRDNLDKLSGLFGQASRLLDIVQVSSNAFGVQNLALNPALERSDATFPTYQNLFVNPSVRRRALATQLQNLAPNPGLTTLQSATYQRTYTDLFTDPIAKYNRANAQQPITSNYWAPTSFEAYDRVPDDGYTPGETFIQWNQQSAVANTVVAVTASDKAYNPTLGSNAMRLLATTAVPANTGIGYRDPAYIGTGFKPDFRFRVRRAQNTTTAREIRIRIDSMDTDMTTVLQSSPWKYISLPAYPVWTDFEMGWTDTNNLSCAQGLFRVIFATGPNAWVAGDGVIVDGIMTGYQEFSSGPFVNRPGPFWDGDTDWGSWSGNYGTSISRWMANNDTRWVPDAPVDNNSAFFRYADRPSVTDPSGTSLNFIAFGYNSGGTQTFTYECATPTAGTPYSLKFGARGRNGTSSTVQLLKRGLNDASPVAVGDVQTVVGSAGNITTGSRMVGAVSYYRSTPYIAAEGDRMFVRVTVPVVTDGNPVLQVTQMSVNDSIFNTFNGDSTDTVNTQHSWEGTPYNSRSIAAQRKIKRISTRHSQITTVTRGTTGQLATTAEVACRFDGEYTGFLFEDIPFSAAQQAQGLFTQIEAVAVGSNFGDLPQATVPSGVLTLSLRNSSGDEVGSFSSPVTQLNQVTADNIANFKMLSVRLSPQQIPSTTATIRVSAYLYDPRRLQAMQVARLQVNPSSVLPTTLLPQMQTSVGYFDGNSAGAVWSGTANDSVSNMQVQFPTSWSVPQGAILAHATELRALAPWSTTKTEATVATTLSADRPAGQFNFGAEVSASVMDASGVELFNTPVDVFLDLRNSATSQTVYTVKVGTISGRVANWKRLQGTLTTSSNFNEARLRFNTTASADSMQVQVRSAFLFTAGTGYTNTVARIGFNKLTNPDFVSGTEFWTASSGTIATVGGTTKGTALVITSSQTISSTAVPVTPGQTLRLSTWGRKAAAANLQPTIWWGTTATNWTSSVNGTAVTQTTYLASKDDSFVVPAGATWAQVRYSGTGAELAAAYLAEDFADHESNGYYDFTLYPYFDGSSVSDAYGSTVSWVGTVDNSISQVTPAFPTAWLNGLTSSSPNAHLITTTARPSELSTGKVGALPRIGKGAQRTFRSLGIAVKEDGYISGELSIECSPGASVVFRLSRAVTASAVGNPIFEKLVTSTTGETVVIKDLDSQGGYVYFELLYTETVNAPGYRVIFDNALLLSTNNKLGDDYPGYFDGNSPASTWTGLINESGSQYLGGGRRAYAELTDSVDMTSMAGGTRAEFQVDLRVPAAFWEDLSGSRYIADGTLDASGRWTYPLGTFTGTTAPIADAIFTLVMPSSITGPVRLTDEMTKAWVLLTPPAATPNYFANCTIVIDNEAYTVTKNGVSCIRYVTRGGSNQLIPITPSAPDKAPEVTLTVAGSPGAVVKLTVDARRKFLLA